MGILVFGVCRDGSSSGCMQLLAIGMVFRDWGVVDWALGIGHWEIGALEGIN